MTTLEQYPTAPPALLILLDEQALEIPEALKLQVEKLKQYIRESLFQDYEILETSLENKLPEVWDLRMRALPILAQFDLTEALQKVQQEFAFIPQQYPPLKEAAGKLNYGLHLMTQFVEKLLSADPKWAQHLPHKLHTVDLPPYREIMASLVLNGAPDNNTLLNLIHGSLMMELLLFVLDIAAEEQLPLDEAICYELNYQSAVAVKQYAGAFGSGDTRMPWYQSPQNDLQRLLLTGPTLNEPDIQYIREKQSHFNSWK